MTRGQCLATHLSAQSNIHSHALRPIASGCLAIHGGCLAAAGNQVSNSGMKLSKTGKSVSVLTYEFG